MRLALPFTLLIMLWVSFHAAVSQAADSVTPLSRQIDLYYALQQRIARPGELSDEGQAGLQLLLAQLYCEMGMLLAAEQTLDALQGGPTVHELHDMGRLLLARQYRQRGDLAAATTQLQSIGGRLDRVLEHEREQMLALSALERGDEGEALRRFGRVQGGEGAVLLARFNYAALLLQGAQPAHGLILLQEIAGQRGDSAALQALRDRANLLLGYYFLQRQQHREAEPFLRRVRLSGPYSRAALLALGWAQLELQGPEYAMVPWMELLAGGDSDSLAEEAQLAIAAAITSKGASQRALDHYQRLIAQFEQEREQLQEERQRHASPYPPQQLATIVQEEGLARDSVAGVALENLLALRQQLAEGRQAGGEDSVDEEGFFERLWPQLHALYPEPDSVSGIGVAAHVARRTEEIIHSFLQSSSRRPRAAADLQARLAADRATLDGEIAVVAEWYRRTRLAGLQAREQRLGAYMERARLAIARNHDLALRRQERE